MESGYVRTKGRNNCISQASVWRPCRVLFHGIERCRCAGRDRPGLPYRNKDGRKPLLHILQRRPCSQERETERRNPALPVPGLREILHPRFQYDHFRNQKENEYMGQIPEVHAGQEDVERVFGRMRYLHADSILMETQDPRCIA